MITDRRQQQALIDLMHGLQPSLTEKDLTRAYQIIWREISKCRRAEMDWYEIQQWLLRFKQMEEGEKLASVIDTILAGKPGEQPKHRSLDQIGPNLRQTTWFWPEWVPRGSLTLLAAWPGVGKTYVALDLAHRIIAGAPAPDDMPFDIRTGTVVYVDAEDFLPDIYERASVWRMDMSRFFPITRPPRDLIDLSRQEYQDQVIDMCYDLQPDLVIVDSLSSVNSRGENNIEDLRDVLNFLVDLADSFDLALILVHHLRKPGKGTTQPVTMHDLRGTGHLVAMARSILGIDILKTGPEDDVNGPRQVKVLKKNRGKYPRPLSVVYKDAPENPDVAVLSYGPIEIFNRYPETLVERCAAWLVELLAEHGPLSYEKIKEYAHDEGFKRGVLSDARKLLEDRVIDTVGPKVKGNKWALAGEVDVHEFEFSDETAADQCTVWLVETLADEPLGYGELSDLARKAGYSENVLQEARQRLGVRVQDTIGSRRRGNKWCLIE